MKKIILILLSMMLILTSCGKKNVPEESVPTWQEQYDLGMKYLLEENYEEAIVAFKNAIKLDEKAVKAYTGLIDSYVKNNQIEEAAIIVETGTEKFVITKTDASTKDVEDFMRSTLQYQKEKDSLKEMCEYWEKVLSALKDEEEYQNILKEISKDLINELKNDKQAYDSTNLESSKQLLEKILELFSDIEEAQSLLDDMSAPQSEDEVVWDDSVFEALIRDKIGISEGDVYVKDLDYIQSLVILGDWYVLINNEEYVTWTAPVYDVTGKKMVAYYGFSFGDGADYFMQYKGNIQSINALKYFRNLTSVAIIANQIKDISVLKDMQLTDVNFYANEITDSSAADAFDIGEQFVVIE